MTEPHYETLELRVPEEERRRNHRPLRCLLGHDWRTTLPPEPQYPGVSNFAGTKCCRRCGAFRYWTPRETAQYERETPWKSW
jgi:hypothetical protein